MQCARQFWSMVMTGSGSFVPMMLLEQKLDQTNVKKARFSLSLKDIVSWLELALRTDEHRKRSILSTAFLNASTALSLISRLLQRITLIWASVLHTRRDTRRMQAFSVTITHGL